MHAKENQSERLEGWKEIAAFFNKSVRTVQVWESDFGLPIHREMKRVWAITTELTAWRESHQDLAVPPTDPPPPPPQPPSRNLWLPAATVLAVLALAAFAWPRPGTPIGYRTLGPVLSTFDASQKTVWTHTFSSPLHEEIRSGPNALQNLRGQFLDVDQDGKPEFLYRTWPWDLSKQNSSLQCFRSDGTLRWTFAPGRPTLKLADGRTISGPYTVQHVALLRHPRPDGGRIVVSSHHSWDWPHQVAILTADGKLVDQYWHPGWIFSLDIADLDNNGRDEILLGGVNNAYLAIENRGATLVVLSADSIHGQGDTPKNSRLLIADLPPSPRHRALLFPEFAKHPNPNHYAHVERISTLPDGSVQIVLTQGFGPSIFDEPYAHLQLDPNLNVTRVLPGAKLSEILSTQHPSATTPEARASLYRKVLADIQNTNP
jgi:hypothetical protein